MILRITDSKEDFGITTYVISLENFGRKEYHPLLASRIWDCVYIDLNEDTPRGIIKQLVKRTKIIPIFDINNVTPRVMQVLCEICPDYTGQIRVAYSNNKEELTKLLMQIKNERWS